LLTLTVSNRGKQPLEASVIFLLTNFIGDDGVQQDWRGNISDFAEVSGWRGVLFRKEPAQRSPRWGTLALLCDDESVEVARRWKVHRLHWNVPTLRLIDALLSEGRMEDAAPNEPCPPSNEQGWDSTLAARFPLPARSQQRVRFLLCWHFPYRDLRELGWWQGREGEDSIVRNYYTLRFRDALDVASHVLPRLDELQQRTLQFVRSVVAKHPPAFCEAALKLPCGAAQPDMLPLGRWHLLRF
jgi:uncharacterized protein (DUF608 family)